jgi:hypothetical protein
MFKLHPLVLVLLLGCSTKVSPDSTNSAETRNTPAMNHGPTNDKLISELEQSLPPGWFVQLAEGRLRIGRKEKVEAKAVNRINAPLDFNADKSENDASDWREVSVRITYQTATPWSDEQWAETRAHNDAIHAEIQALAEKLGLVERATATKTGLQFETSPPEQQAAVAQHDAEREALLTKRIPTPDCSTQHHSLFLLSKEGFEDAYQLIRPEAASRESYEVLELIKTRCAR